MLLKGTETKYHCLVMIISNHCRFARTKMDGSAYFVLLIITDGVITDMPQTTQAIVEVSCQNRLFL